MVLIVRINETARAKCFLGFLEAGSNIRVGYSLAGVVDVSPRHEAWVELEAWCHGANHDGSWRLVYKLTGLWAVSIHCRCFLWGVLRIRALVLRIDIRALSFFEAFPYQLRVPDLPTRFTSGIYLKMTGI